MRSYRLCLDAVAGIGRLARTLDPKQRCAWRAAPSLYLASRRKDVPALEAEYAARSAIGIEVDLLTERDLRAALLLHPAGGTPLRPAPASWMPSS